MAHPGGRPTKYNEEILVKAQQYLTSCQDQEVEQEKKEGWITYKTKVKLPTIEGMALYLGISRETMYAWSKEHAEFSDILEALRLEQADRLQNSGLSGDYNSTIAKLILSARHDMKEKTDVTSEDKALTTQPILVKILRNGEDNLDS